MASLPLLVGRLPVHKIQNGCVWCLPVVASKTYSVTTSPTPRIVKVNSRSAKQAVIPAGRAQVLQESCTVDKGLLARPAGAGVLAMARFDRECTVCEMFQDVVVDFVPSFPWLVVVASVFEMSVMLIVSLSGLSLSGHKSSGDVVRKASTAGV